MPAKSPSLVDVIKGPVGFVLALFVTLVMAGMSALSEISDELKTACTTVESERYFLRIRNGLLCDIHDRVDFELSQVGANRIP